MEEEDTIIIQVIFKFEDGRLYTFDVDHTTTLYEVKKILTNAAHILKPSIILYHEGQEVSKDHDPLPLFKIFPSLKKIEFHLKLIKSSEEVDENEHEKISVKYNIRQPCKEHIGKFLVLYCLSCKKSICNECFSEAHNNHEVEEKADYLMPAKILMERIFANSFMFKSDPKISNYMSCVSFRSIIKTDIFDRMRHLINELENKTINCLEFFSFNEDSTEKNNDLNLELLKKYCTASFIKLKNNIDIKDILINDEVFLSLYNKLKAIKDYEIALFTENSNKYKALNTFFLPFTQEIKNMSMDLNNILLRYINKDIYAKFKEDVARNVVDVVQKEDVVRFMFENVNAPKTKLGANSSLMKQDENNINKNSLTPNMTQRLLPSLLLMNEPKNVNNAVNNINNVNSINTSNINISSKQNNFGNVASVGIGSNVNNLNTVNTMSNISNINTMNNVNTMNTVNTMNMNSTSNVNMNNMNNVNMNLNNVNNMNNASSVNISKTFQQVKDSNFVITSPIQFSHTRTSNFSTINIPSTLNNINPTSTMNNNTNLLANSGSNISNINNMNSILNTVNSCSNITSTINNNALNSAKSSKKSNTNMTNNNTSNTNNVILLQSGEKENEKQKQEKSDIMEIEETQNSPNQNQKKEIINYSESKIEEIKANLSDKNISGINNCSSPMMKKTFINIHLSPNKREDNFDNRSVILSQNFLPNQSKGLFSQTTSKERKMEITTTTQTKIESHTTNIRNSINQVSLFGGKLIDVLNKEKENTINNINNNINTNLNMNTINNMTNTATSMELELNKENKEENNLSQKAELGSSMKKSTFTQEEFVHLTSEKKDKEKKVEKLTDTNTNKGDKVKNETPNTTTNVNNTNNTNNTNPPSKKAFTVSFMYPVFKTNIVKGSVDKNTVQEIKINFPTEYTEFVQGGAYCNYEGNLYFTGGHEYIKDAGKLCLVIRRNDIGNNAIRLPDMKYPHWNHSMIADKGKIYVIGGYGSNKCEMYDLSSNTWSEMPDLIEKERQRSMLYIDNNFLYCFMGKSQNTILSTVERINLDNINAGWESIIVDTAKGITNLKFYGAGIIKNNNSNKIYFIGGKKEKRNKEEVYKRSIYEFCFDNYKMTKSEFKIENDLVFIENILFPMDEGDCGNLINVGNGFIISMHNLQ